MATKKPTVAPSRPKLRAAPAVAAVELSRSEWALAFESRVERLRAGMGSKYLATIVATLYPKHRADDPESVAAQWVKEHEASS